MPVTPDLKDNEFEVTIHCPVGECPAIIAWVYDKKHDNPKDIAAARKIMKTKAKQQHSVGGHLKRVKVEK